MFEGREFYRDWVDKFLINLIIVKNNLIRQNMKFLSLWRFYGTSVTKSSCLMKHFVSLNFFFYLAYINQPLAKGVFSS
jgi:hypothetical protein